MYMHIDTAVTAGPGGTSGTGINIDIGASVGGAVGAILVLILAVVVIVISTAVCVRRKNGADLQKELLGGYLAYGRYI